MSIFLTSGRNGGNRMGNKLVFDYFFGKESEMFSFYRIPRMLIKDPNFSHLSCEAKLLYGLMLDRMALSQRNGWHDDDNRTYIIYTMDIFLIAGSEWLWKEVNVQCLIHIL